MTPHLFFIDSYSGKNTEHFLSFIKSGERYRTIMDLLFALYGYSENLKNLLLQKCQADFQIIL